MLRLATAAVLPFLTAFASIPATMATPDPTGQTLRVVAVDDQESRLQFEPQGRVVATSGERSFTGRWTADDDGLCFRWTETFVECWPYARPFVRGETVTITSDRGNVVRVTRL
jgi:hypothetical protein